MLEKAFFIDQIDYGSRGLRLHSFMPHSICFGNVCAIFVAVFFFLYSKDYQKKYCRICMILLVAGIILSNSRTPIIALFLYTIPVLYKYLNFEKRILFFFLLILAIYFVGDKIIQTLDGLFVEGSKYEMGSSMTMRLEQLDATLHIARHTLWFGLGFNYDLSSYVMELRGAESVWFNYLICGGIFAVIAEISMFFQAFSKTKEFESYRNILWITIGYFFQQSSTYNSGLNDFLFYFSIIIIMNYDIIFIRSLKYVNVSSTKS